MTGLDVRCCWVLAQKEGKTIKKKAAQTNRIKERAIVTAPRNEAETSRATRRAEQSNASRRGRGRRNAGWTRRRGGDVRGECGRNMRFGGDIIVESAEKSSPFG